MALKPDERWFNAEAELPEGMRPLPKQLREDYLAAARRHVPRWTGGPNPKILTELIRHGWRKGD